MSDGITDVPPIFEGDPNAPAPTAGSTSSKPSVTSLGNGYSLVQWTVPTYDPVSQGMVDKPMSQIVPDKDAASVAAVEAAKVAAGAAGTSARITTEGANQRAAVQAEIDRARNAADAAHQQALDALAQGNAAEARRQFAVTSQETQRAHDLDASIRQQEADLAKNKFGFDVYNKLSDLASNPRNYMEQFFRLRGSPSPANSAQYGNGGQQGIVPFEQFLPNFLKSTFGASSSSGQTGAAGASTPAAPASPRGGTPMGVDPGYDNATEAAHTTYANSPENFSRITGAVRAGGLPQSALTNLPQPVNAQGTPEQNVGGAAITPSDFAVRKNLDLSSSTKQFADGGTLRMTAPHAIVNLLTGRVAAIAGEQPGNGPQGFVPETARFDGQAMIDEGYTDKTSTPNPGDPILPQEPLAPQPAEGSSAALDPGYVAPAGSFNVTPPGVGFNNPPLNPLPIPGVVPANTSAPHANEYIAPAAPQPFAPIEREPVAPLPYLAPQPLSTGSTPTGPTTGQNVTSGAGTSGTTTGSVVTQPIQLPQGVDTNAVSTYGLADSGVTPSRLPTNVFGGTPGAVDPNGMLPPAGGFGSRTPSTFGTPGAIDANGAMLPGTGGIGTRTPPTFGAPGTVDANGMLPPAGTGSLPTRLRSNVMPKFLDQLSALSHTPSGLGQNPSFLPEDAAQQNPIVRSLMDNGAFAPFLQRLYAQDKGLAGLGTNVPQQTNLPAGVPLASRLALSQMSPSELAAFQSFISANGLDWNDYLAMIDAASPQGGVSKLQNSLPKYLSQ